MLEAVKCVLILVCFIGICYAVINYFAPFSKEGKKYIIIAVVLISVSMLLAATCS